MTKIYRNELVEGIDLAERTEKQQQIIEQAVDEPELSQVEIGEQIGASASYVSYVCQDYVRKIPQPSNISPSDIGEDLYEMIPGEQESGEKI